MFEKLIGKFVVVRSDKDGVWAGTLRDIERNASGEDRVTVSLDGACLVHSWRNTAATAGLAVFGPGEGSNVSDFVEHHVCTDVFGISACTASAKKRFVGCKKWNP